MKNILLLWIALTLVLAACGGQPAQTPTPISPTEPPQQAPTQIAPPPTGLITYTITPGDSQVKYEVGEVLINQNNRINTAVGVTPQISGEIHVDWTHPQNSSLGPITVDISQFKSDSSRRDSTIRDRFLESSRFPQATFVTTQIDGLPESYQPGQEIPLQIQGNLTIREVTQPITFNALLKIENDLLTGSANTTIRMSDFGFGPIDMAGILKTEDEVRVSLNISARPTS